jgi:hypothetical protein
MKKFLSFIAFLILSVVVNAQYSNVESYWSPSPNIQEAATSTAFNVYHIDSLETRMWGTDRIRGYIVPPQTGYYKFY